MLSSRLRPWWCTRAALGTSLRLAGIGCFFGACAEMHHYQLADIDATQGALVPISVQVGSTGFNLEEASQVVQAMQSSRQRQKTAALQDIISLFQYGPSTGDPTFTDSWADEVTGALLAQCPSGRITGVNCIRERMDYPVVSGEIVTVKGFCIR
jgi:hypothetical protein